MILLQAGVEGFILGLGGLGFRGLGFRAYPPRVFPTKKGPRIYPQDGILRAVYPQKAPHPHLEGHEQLLLFLRDFISGWASASQAPQHVLGALG